MIPPLEALELVVTRIISFALAFGAVILFFMLITAGFKYLTSSGDPKAIEGAKKTLTTAITGLVMLLGSFLILKIIANFTGVNIGATSILNFKIVRP